jgi:carboxyl-terminal processing protease
VKTTVAKFYRPGSSSTQNRGVESDVVLPSLNNHLEVGESSLENSLPWDALSRVNLKPWGDFAPYLPAIAERSRQRQLTSAHFRQVNQDIQQYQERKKNTKEITIRQVLAEREQDAKEGAAKRPEKPKPDPAKAATQPDPVLNETMEILIDYIRMSTGGNTIAIGKSN